MLSIRVYLDRSEVSAQAILPLGGKLLISEDYHGAFGH